MVCWDCPLHASLKEEWSILCLLHTKIRMLVKKQHSLKKMPYEIVKTSLASYYKFFKGEEEEHEEQTSDGR